MCLVQTEHRIPSPRHKNIQRVRVLFIHGNVEEELVWNDVPPSHLGRAPIPGTARQELKRKQKMNDTPPGSGDKRLGRILLPFPSFYK